MYVMYTPLELKSEDYYILRYFVGSISGKGADLLIHEATLEDGMEEEAKKKRHRYGPVSGFLSNFYS